MIPRLLTAWFPIYWVPQRVGRPSQNGYTIDFKCFQFIGFPSEWGALMSPRTPTPPLKFPIYWVPQRVGRGPKSVLTYTAAAGFPIYWVPQRVGSRHVGRAGRAPHCFQFIGFPSEWGVQVLPHLRIAEEVSNLLGSPASGELSLEDVYDYDHVVSNLLGSPASGELFGLALARVDAIAFPIYWVPQRVGRYPY